MIAGYSWLEIVRTLWPVIATIASVASALGVAWLSTKFATKQETIKLASVGADHETRIKLLEELNSQPPSRAALHDDINDMAERLSAMEASQSAIEKQLDTSNSYLKVLVENAIGSGKP